MRHLLLCCLACAALLGGLPALAQGPPPRPAPPDTSRRSAALPDTAARKVARADTTAAPAVAPAAGGAAGVPSAEFETYNKSGYGLRYTASLTALYTSGTVERTFLTTGHTASFAFRGGRFKLPVGFNYSYGRQDGLLRERELLLLLTPSYQALAGGGRVKFYGLAQAERSNLRAIDRRVLLGGGVGYQLFRDSLQNEVAVSYFLLHDDTRFLTGLRRQVLRHSLRVTSKLALGPATLSTLLYYQPAVRTPRADYRLNGTATAGVKLSRQLAFTLSYTYSYERITVEDRSPQNTNLSAGLTYSTGAK